MLKIKVIVGSTREGRFSEKLLPWITEAIDTQDGIECEVLDLRDYEIPYYDNAGSPKYVKDGNYSNETVVALAKKINEADAFLVIAPEYNHGYSAVLKNVLDSIYSEWNQKPVGFVSYGSVGGGRAVEQLRQVVVELQMAPISNAVHIQAPWFIRNEAGELKEGVLTEYDQALTDTLTQLVWWGNALKVARGK